MTGIGNSIINSAETDRVSGNLTVIITEIDYYIPDP
jgi:hypothetical protein